MVDRMKDADDRTLEALFQAEPIADDGFSDRIVGKLRRRLWLRRLSLPIATVVGGAIAIKPMVAVGALFVRVLSSLPAELVASSTSWIPSLQMLVTGGMLLAVGVFGLRMLED